MEFSLTTCLARRYRNLRHTQTQIHNHWHIRLQTPVLHASIISNLKILHQQISLKILLWLNCRRSSEWSSIMNRNSTGNLPTAPPVKQRWWKYSRRLRELSRNKTKKAEDQFCPPLQDGLIYLIRFLITLFFRLPSRFTCVVIFFFLSSIWKKKKKKNFENFVLLTKLKKGYWK